VLALALLHYTAAQELISVEPDSWTCPSLAQRLTMDSEDEVWARVDDLACQANENSAHGRASAISARVLLKTRGNSTAVRQYRHLLDVLHRGGADALQQEREATERAMLEAGSMANTHPERLWKAELQASILRRVSCSIPNIVHFIKTDGNPKNFKMIHFLSLKSVQVNMRPDAIYFYAPTEPQGYWWDKIKVYVKFIQVLPPAFIGQKRLHYAAHQSDVMRFQILLLKGGIYLDWDVIVLKPFTELLNSGHPMLMGEEKRVPGYQYAISNAVMMARPRSRFISQWLSELKHIFQPNCYTCHSGEGVEMGEHFLRSPTVMSVTRNPSRRDREPRAGRALASCVNSTTTQ